MRTEEQTPVDAREADDRAIVAGNARLTALASAVLFVLLLVEFLTVPNLHELIAVHLFVGVLLLGPLAVKLGSTGYRFLRYYMRSPAFVRAGPPHMALRVLAPLLVITTLAVIGTGIALLAIPPDQAGTLRVVHVFSFLFWLPLVAVHALAHIGQVPRLIRDDWSKHSAEEAPGRTFRLSMILGALVAGVVAVIVALPAVAPWVDWIRASETGPGPFIVGTVAAVLVLVAARAFRWR